MTADPYSLPYEELDIAEALAKLAPEDTALVRPYAPALVAVDVPAAAVTVPAAPTFTPREPSAPVLVSRRDTGTLRQLSRSLQGLDFAAVDAAQQVPGLTYAAVRGGTPIGDQVEAGRRPAGRHAATGPGWPEGTVRGLLIGALWDAVRWYGDLNGDDCADCDHPDEHTRYACEEHRGHAAKAVGCEKLYDCVCAALSDTGALALVAAVIQSGGIDLSDLAAPGSPLERILSDALGTDRGAR